MYKGFTPSSWGYCWYYSFCGITTVPRQHCRFDRYEYCTSFINYCKGINKTAQIELFFKQRLLIKRYWTYISNFSVNYYNVINDDWRFPDATSGVNVSVYVPAGTPFNWNSQVIGVSWNYSRSNSDYYLHWYPFKTGFKTPFITQTPL
jgi:hypothetical protein